MLELLHLKNVGPAPEMKMELAPRLNLITGDNGLGKSFLLDVAWWALTRSWAGYRVRPTLETIKARKKATISFRYDGAKKKRDFMSEYIPLEQKWKDGRGRPANPGLVLYARVDGSFAVWDPTRNQKAREIARSDGLPPPNLPRLYKFFPSQVWDGLAGEDSQMLCNGLIRDWDSWQRSNNDSFAILRQVLRTLSEAGDLLEPGEPVRISIDDARDHPTLRTSYGQNVPIVYASAAVRRMVALAYLLVWTWTEHSSMSAQLGIKPTRRIVFLVDEVESHLHPRWQRTVVPSLMQVVQALAPKADAQLIAATHSPLVLASVESVFDPKTDAWFDFDLDRRVEPAEVVLSQRPFVRHGEVGNWLTSQAFDLRSARSVEAEELLERAADALSSSDFSVAAARELDTELRTVLGDTDPFWIRWRFVGEKRGWLPVEPSEHRSKTSKGRKS